MIRVAESENYVVTNIGQLLTNAPLKTVDIHAGRGIEEDDLGLIPHAWLHVTNGKVTGYGSLESGLPDNLEHLPKLDAKGALVTPGLIDCHTHPIFGGDRSQEFKLRLNGESYQSIAAKGGGIQSTIKATRAASDQDLTAGLKQHLQDFLRQGITTVEVKSGYGQNAEQELRLLRIIKSVRRSCPQTLEVTYLGLHALSEDFNSHQAMIAEMAGEDLLKTILSEQLASWCDGFIENGYFPPEIAEPFFTKAKAAGLKIRIHADELADSNAAEAAARWGAKSADHLECVSASGMAAMAKSNCVAVLLPGTSLYSKLPFTQADALRATGCRIAVASDFNPGSCYLKNLVMLASLAGIHAGLRAAEVVAAITYNAAYSLDLQDRKGHLDIGADADFVIHRFSNAWAWLADCGQQSPEAVFIAGDLQTIN